MVQVQVQGSSEEPRVTTMVMVDISLCMVGLRNWQLRHRHAGKIGRAVLFPPQSSGRSAVRSHIQYTYCTIHTSVCTFFFAMRYPGSFLWLQSTATYYGTVATYICLPISQSLSPRKPSPEHVKVSSHKKHPPAFLIARPFECTFVYSLHTLLVIIRFSDSQRNGCQGVHKERERLDRKLH